MQVYNITEDQTSYKHKRGLAWCKERIIKIPNKFETPYHFLVAIHEISHITCMDKRKNKPYEHDYIREYETEVATIKLAKGLNIIPIDHLTYYIEDSKKYVLAHLLEEFSRHKSDKFKLRYDTLKWIGIKEEQLHNEYDNLVKIVNTK